jgi:PKHD-type hydroxylase
MNLQNYYWYFQSALSKDFCENLIKFGNQQREELALTGGQTDKIKEGKELTEQDLKDLKKKRDSNIVWLNEQWIYDEILPYINTANKNSGWNFEFSWSESCQFTKYKQDQYYDWHCDSWDRPYGEDFNNPNLRGKIRKLSVTCNLTDPSEYEGGELEFDYRNLDPDKPANIKICEEVKPQGSIVVFPSHVWHRVKPVTKGTRYSLVIWSCGYPFK